MTLRLVGGHQPQEPTDNGAPAFPTPSDGGTTFVSRAREAWERHGRPGPDQQGRLTDQDTVSLPLSRDDLDRIQGIIDRALTRQDYQTAEFLTTLAARWTLAYAMRTVAQRGRAW